MPVTKLCANSACGRPFSGPPAIMVKRSHCSKSCQKRRATYVCEGCGGTFEARHCEMPRRFCGDGCRLAWFSRAFVGEASPQWRGGALENYGPSWKLAREQARARDRYCCRGCGAHEDDLPEQLSVAHLKPFRLFGLARHREANALDNLRSFCRRCHLIFDHANGARARTNELLALELATA
jgi:hypothetical protein